MPNEQRRSNFSPASYWPLVDLALLCALLASGRSLQVSHMASFAAGIALNYLLKVRSMATAGTTRGWRVHYRLAAVALMALFLRGGVLCITALNWGWPSWACAILTVLAGLAVVTPGFAYVLSAATGEARTRSLAIGLIAYACALRLVYLGCVELMPEEAYYWNYSRHLDIGYLDHPPMVAWLIRAGTAIFGLAPFGVRFGALACGAIASLFAYRLARNLFGQSSARSAVVLLQTLPFFFLAAWLMTPDTPLTAAWAACMYYLERVLIAGERRAWWGLGVALGLGMISKYSIGLLVPVALLFMLWDEGARPWWRSWRPYAAALLALAIFSPVIIWNANHEWASFAFQTSRRLGEAPRFALHKLIASSLLLLTPVGAAAVSSALFGTWAARLWNSPRERRLMRLAVLVPLGVFFAFSLRHEVKLDWTGAPWIGAVPMMAASMAAGLATGAGGFGARLRAAWPPTLLVLMLMYGAGLHYLALGLPGIGYSRQMELVPVGWRGFSRQIEAIAAETARQTGVTPLIVGMDRYAIASELAFYGAASNPAAAETTSAHLFGQVGLMYQFWAPARSQDGRTLILVGWDRAQLSGPAIESHVKDLGPIMDGVLSRDGKVIRHYAYRLAYNYRSSPAP